MIRLERRVDRPRWLTVAVPVASVAAALVIGAVLLAATGHDALGTYQRILDRGFTSRGAFTATLTAATPLLFTGLCAAAAFRMGVFNIGGEMCFGMFDSNLRIRFVHKNSPFRKARTNRHRINPATIGENIFRTAKKFLS